MRQLSLPITEQSPKFVTLTHFLREEEIKETLRLAFLTPLRCFLVFHQLPLLIPLQGKKMNLVEAVFNNALPEKSYLASFLLV